MSISNGKTCTRCKVFKEPIDFSAHGANLDGLQSHCKDCRNDHRRKTHDPIKARGYSLRKNYAMTESAYVALLESQGHRCRICLKLDSELHEHKGQPGYLSVDHDFLDGSVRGLLCRPCNQMLAHVEDSAEVLQRAISYLEDFDVRRVAGHMID